MELFGLSEGSLRLTAFLVIFGTMTAFELWSPRLERAEFNRALKTKRWFTNIGILIVSSIILRVAFPAAAVGIAVWAQAMGFGLFNLVEISPIIAGLFCFIVLDFAVWLEHVMSHKWQWLWRIHRVHHSDTGFDVTTALRFHPLEIIISMIWKAGVVAVLGVPVIAVLVFEIVLNGSAMFNHANVKLPLRLDRFLRKFIVTPDMHRVHHSQEINETNSNYGFNFSIWDHLFRTYKSGPAKGMEAIDIGLKEYESSTASNLVWALKLPLKP